MKWRLIVQAVFRCLRGLDTDMSLSSCRMLKCFAPRQAWKRLYGWPLWSQGYWPSRLFHTGMLVIILMQGWQIVRVRSEDPDNRKVMWYLYRKRSMRAPVCLNEIFVRSDHLPDLKVGPSSPLFRLVPTRRIESSSRVHGRSIREWNYNGTVSFLQLQTAHIGNFWFLCGMGAPSKEGLVQLGPFSLEGLSKWVCPSNSALCTGG